MGKGGSTDTSGEDARVEEERRKAAVGVEIANIEDVFSAFGPEYWAGQTTDLESRYNPQIDTAFGEARGNLLADLASKGQGKGSSVYQQGVGKLEEEGRVVRENLANSIMSSIAAAEGDVLNRKQNLMSTVRAASDPAGAGAGAAALAQTLKAPVQSGFDVSGAFRDYKDMQTIGDILKSSARPGGVRSFGGTNVSGKVIQ